MLDDDNGDPYVLTHCAARRHDGRYGGYLYIVQQLTYSSSQRQRGLSLFGHLAMNDKDTATMDYQIQAGAIYQGPFASRPQDFISFGVSKMHANDRVARRAQLLNQMRGSMIMITLCMFRFAEPSMPQSCIIAFARRHG